jgi:energy-converting hydrogenase Eha subunit A
MTIAMDERSLGSMNSKAEKAADFYVYMTAAAAAIAFAGFAPTYWAPLMTGTFKGPPVIHLHAAAFFSWTLFAVFQTWLAASGRTAWHRTLGMAGVSLATLMTVFGVLTTIVQVKAIGAAGYAQAGEAFAIVPVASIVFFAVAFILAVANVRRPEWHKRLILLATLSILDAPIARWFMVFMAPPDAAGPPPVAVDILPAAVVALLLAVAVAFDWRKRGRPHSAYVAGSLAFVAVKVLQAPVSETPAWHAMAGWLLGLAG